MSDRDTGRGISERSLEIRLGHRHILSEDASSQQKDTFSFAEGLSFLQKKGHSFKMNSFSFKEESLS